MPTLPSEWADAANFALKAALVTALDGLDQYMKVLGRIPELTPDILTDILAGRARDAQTKRRYTIPQRLQFLNNQCDDIGSAEQIAAIYLLSTWRNHFVHGDYRFDLEARQRKSLADAVGHFRSSYGNADVAAMLHGFDRREPPKIGDLMTLFTCAQRLVASIDEHLLQLQKGPDYAVSLLTYLLREANDPSDLLERLFRGGGAQSTGAIHALFLHHGGNHHENRIASAPFATRAELHRLFGMGRNAASEKFGIARPEKR